MERFFIDLKLDKSYLAFFFESNKLSMFKRIFGFILLFAFIGYMTKKLTDGTDHLQNNLLILGFVFVVILILVLIVRKILLS